MGDLRPKPDNKSVGERSQAIILARLSEVGYSVMNSFGENHRYDLVIEDADGIFHRIQCKTGCISNGCIDFSTASSYYHHPRKGGKTDHWRRDYRGQIEYFAVYSPDTKRIYLVPVDHVPLTEGNLRLEPTKNNQEKLVRWAKDYEL